MKLGYLFSVAIIPCLISTASIFDFQQKGNDKEKGNGKDNSNKEWKDNSKKDRDQGNYQDNNRKENPGKGKDYADKDKGKKSDWKSNGKGNGKWDDASFDNRLNKIKSYKKGKWARNLNYDSINWWNDNDIYNAKKPKNNKKVTVCHKPNGSDNPVNINVSVNALKAHLNHGDLEGKCNDFDRSRYSDNYWNTRNDYYNQYISTSETMSFGEQLLIAAIGKLTNAKTQLVSQRNTLSASDLERKQLALMNLQNDTYQLQQSLERSNDRVVQVNLNF